MTYTHHHDLNSRPRQFNPTTHQPACTHTRNPSLSSSPLRLMIIRFPSFLHVSPALSPLVFTIIFSLFFSHFGVYICLSHSLVLVSARLSTDHRPHHDPFHRFFSDPSRISFPPGSTYPEIHGNPKQYRIGKHLDIFYSARLTSIARPKHPVLLLLRPRALVSTA